MAERKIGLRIELNGFRGVVSNMKELEDEIRKAKEDLAELEIGGSLFKQLSGEISRAETELGKLRKTTEGISVEKQVEGYGKLAAGITGGFAAASAAMSLFGSDTEEMSKAAVQAQNLITLALSARSLAELKTGAAIVATTIATQAEAVANNLATKSTWFLNTAMKGLFTTIAANPIGAMVVALGLAITAMMAFGDETEQQSVNLNEINSKVGDTEIKLAKYAKMLNQSVKGSAEHTLAVKELKKEMPGLNALLDENGHLNNMGNKYIADKIQLLKLQAKSQALANAQAQLQTELLMNQNKPLEEQLGTWDKIKGYMAYLYFGDFGKAYQNAADAENNRSEAAKNLEKQLKAIQQVDKENDAELAKIIARMEEGNKAMELEIENEKKAAAAKDKKNEMTKDQIALYDALAKKIVNLVAGFKDAEEALKLLNIEATNVPEPAILKRTKDIITARESLKSKEFLQIIADFGLGVDKLTDGTLVAVNELTKLGDTFGKEYRQFENDITELFFNGETNVKSYMTLIDEFTGKITEFVKTGVITPEAVKPITDILNQYKGFVDFIQTSDLDIIEVLGVKQGGIEFRKLNDAIFDILTILGKYGDLTEEERNKLPDYQKALKSVHEVETAYYNGLMMSLKKKNDAKIKEIELEIQHAKKLGVSQDKILELEEKLKDQKTEAVKTYEELAENQSKIFTKAVLDLATNEATIFKTSNDLAKLAISGGTDASQLYIKTITSNMDAFVKMVEGSGKTAFGKMTSNVERLNELNKLLAKQGVDTTKMSLQEKLALLQEFLKAEEALMTESEYIKQQKIQETLDKIKFATTEISSDLSQIASIAAQRFQLALSQLTNEYNNDMEDLKASAVKKDNETQEEYIERTKGTNEKLLELEKIYQQQKKDIEKQSQLTALKFSMAQAITDGASAILDIWAAHAANPILAGVLTGIAVGITAYQVDTINQQIQQVSSMRRGGILGNGGILAGGGMASGPSHEMGGIYAGGGTYIEGNEAVINRQSSLQYAGLLSQINQAGGGRPIMVQSPMDSRLVEALAKQNQTPIRAYVVEQDMTKAQAINKRLEQLASF